MIEIFEINLKKTDLKNLRRRWHPVVSVKL